MGQKGEKLELVEGARKKPVKSAGVDAATRRAIVARVTVHCDTYGHVARMFGLDRYEVERVMAAEMRNERTRAFEDGFRRGKLSMMPHPTPPAPGVVPIKRRAA